MININYRRIKIGKKLRKLRIEEGKTQKDIADLFGISEGAVGMYEQGRRVPNDEIKRKYAILFKKSVDEIFFIF